MVREKDILDIFVDIDDGDGKFNVFFLSCSFFRNELGGEEERIISSGRIVINKLFNRNNNNIFLGISVIIFIRFFACCGLFILDFFFIFIGFIFFYVVLYRGYVIEYVDYGVSYYRYFFYGYGRFMLLLKYVF